MCIAQLDVAFIMFDLLHDGLRFAGLAFALAMNQL